ncbi:protein kinase domain-containing protein [Sinorhizobium fredii]|uniref:protein kinase domain-containing protein n=1 Tax=Rhizobium fredii TaxID=380 RepID=UPI00351483E2
MAKRSSLPEGYILEGYEISKVLGAGGFGITYLALDPALKRFFAIKEYCPHDLAERDGYTVHPLNSSVSEDYERGLRDFIKEAQTLARFHHRNIVGVARIFEKNNTAYMVLNFEEGKSLKDWLRDSDLPPNQLQIDQIAEPLLDALSTIHADNILHRDIAPDNIYIRKDGTPVLLDFGSARQALQQRSRSISAIVKAGYSPQEQYSTRSSNQGPWTDIYALAATVYRCLAGEAPPEASDRTIDDTYLPLSRRNLKGFRATFLEAIDWALRLRPKERPQSIEEWRGPLLKNQKVPPPKKTDAPVKGRPTSMIWQRWVIATAALLMIGAGVGTTAFFFSRHFASIKSESENRVAHSRRDVEEELKAAEKRRQQLDDTRSSLDLDLSKFRREVEESRRRSAALEEELATARKGAEKSNEADRRKFLAQIQELQSRIDEERKRAAASQTSARRIEDALELRISELQAQLQAELRAREAALNDAEALRNASLSAKLEFAGLELAPDAVGQYRVKSVRQDSVFNGKISQSEIISGISRNAKRVDLGNSAAVQADDAAIAGCDVLIADVGKSSAHRSIQAIVPYDFKLEGNAPETEISQVGISVVRSSNDSSLMIQRMESGSPFEEAGIRAGDRIVAISGVMPATIAGFAEMIAEAEKAKKVLTIWFARDCAGKRTASVQFGKSNAARQIEWGGLIFEGMPQEPPKLKAVLPGGILNGIKMQQGDVLQAVTINESMTYLPTMMDATKYFPNVTPCGSVALRYLRDRVRTTQVNTYNPVSGKRTELSVLGLIGWPLEGDKGFEIAEDPTAKLKGVGLRKGDIITQIGLTDGARISEMTREQQQFFAGRGGEIAIIRDCVVSRLNVEKEEPTPAIVDLASLSALERRAIVNALYALGFYRSQKSPQNFFSSGYLGTEVLEAIAAYKDAHGEKGQAALSRGDVDYLLLRGGGEMPSSVERSIIEQILPGRIAGNPASYLDRIRLFLKSKGFKSNGIDDESIRHQLRLYQISRGDSSPDGYIDLVSLANEALSSTVSIEKENEISLDVTSFDDWVYQAFDRRKECIIFSSPIEIEGFLFDYSLGVLPPDGRPFIYLAVNRGETGNRMYMNFGGTNEYATNASVFAEFDDGRKIRLDHESASAFFPPGKTEGSSSDEVHKALRTGRWVDIVGDSSYGGKLRIRYSARGFTSAFHHMARDCNAPGILDWLR